MAEEGEGEFWLAPDAPATRSHRVPERREVGRAEVGQFAALQVAPEQFDGIEIRCIGGETFDVQPGRLLRGKVAGHAAALVRPQAIPDEHDLLAAEVPLQSAQEGDERGVRVRARLRLKVQAGAPAIPPKRERRGDRQALPIRPRVLQHGSLAARRPRAPYDRVLRHAAFVLEDYPSVAAPRVFFTSDQRWRRHWRIAASSRSRAWRAGRWSDQFNPCRIRQTWAG